MVVRDESIDLEFVVWVVIGLVLTAGIFLALFRFIGALVFALFVYYASRPMYERIEEHTQHPDVAVTTTILVFVIPILAVLVYGAFVAFQQATAFVAETDFGWLEPMLGPFASLGESGGLGELIGQLQENPNQVLDEDLRQALRRNLGSVQTIADLAVAIGSRLFLIFVFLFYLLRDDGKIAHWFRRSVGHDHRAVEFFEGVDEDLQKVFYGNMLTIVATGLIAVATYLILDFFAPEGSTLYRPILLGVLVGIGTLVPIVGMKIVYVPFAGLLFFEASTGAAPLWFPVTFLVVTFVVVDTVPDFFVRAFLSAGELNMGLVLLAYVLGTMAFGWQGLFLGPIILVGFVHFARTIFPALIRHRTQ